MELVAEGGMKRRQVFKTSRNRNGTPPVFIPACTTSDVTRRQGGRACVMRACPSLMALCCCAPLLCVFGAWPRRIATRRYNISVSLRDSCAPTLDSSPHASVPFFHCFFFVVLSGLVLLLFSFSMCVLLVVSCGALSGLLYTSSETNRRSARENLAG